MTIYVVVGANHELYNTSARAVYSTREKAEEHLRDQERMWFDDEAVIVELALDAEEDVTQHKKTA